MRSSRPVCALAQAGLPYQSQLTSVVLYQRGPCPYTDPQGLHRKERERWNELWQTTTKEFRGTFSAPRSDKDTAATAKVALNPGFLLKIRDTLCDGRAWRHLQLTSSSTSYSVTVGSSQITDAALVRYGQNSITAAMFPNAPLLPVATSTVLSPNYDSGHIKFDDLEPFFGHLYQLCPTLPSTTKVRGHHNKAMSSQAPQTVFLLPTRTLTS